LTILGLISGVSGSVSDPGTLFFVVDYCEVTGSIRLGSLFLTFPTRWLTGHATISPVYEISSDFS